MKKLLLALVATAAFTGSASAADLAARPYTKAPVPMAPLYNWTGFYIFGGAGWSLWNADSNVVSTGVVGGLGLIAPAGTALTRDQRRMVGPVPWSIASIRRNSRVGSTGFSRWTAPNRSAS